MKKVCVVMLSLVCLISGAMDDEFISEVPSLKQLCANSVASRVDQNFIEETFSKIPSDCSTLILEQLSDAFMKTYDFKSVLSSDNVTEGVKITVIEQLSKPLSLKLKELESWNSNIETVTAQMNEMAIQQPHNALMTLYEDLALPENIKQQILMKLQEFAGNFLIERLYKTASPLIKKEGKQTADVVLWSPNGHYYGLYKDGEKRLIVCNEEHQVIFETDIHRYAWSPDGQYIAVSFAGKLKIWDMQGKLLATIDNGAEKITTIAWSSDNNYVAISDFDHSIKIWCTKSSICKHVVKKKGFIQAIAWSPDNAQILAVSNKVGLSGDIDIAVHNIHQDSDSIPTINTILSKVSWKQPTTNVIWISRGVFIVRKNDILLYDNNFGLIRTFQIDSACDWDWALSPDGNYFVVLDFGKLNFFSIDQEKPIITFKAIRSSLRESRDYAGRVTSYTVFPSVVQWINNGQYIRANFDCYDLSIFEKMFNNYQFSVQEIKLLLDIMHVERIYKKFGRALHVCEEIERLKKSNKFESLEDDEISTRSKKSTAIKKLKLSADQLACFNQFGGNDTELGDLIRSALKNCHISCDDDIELGDSIRSMFDA